YNDFTIKPSLLNLYIISDRCLYLCFSNYVLYLDAFPLASTIDEFIQNELNLEGIPPELMRLGIERLLQNSPLKYKFDGSLNSNQN
ncbi:hypothetical protein, partial [Aulosira sp. FACHB-615]|uniref:hypothetical protein n=1 Tax=Aulosira sp. FACHB-615 TaxID=2692777 RepID=UPI001688F978